MNLAIFPQLAFQKNHPLHNFTLQKKRWLFWQAIFWETISIYTSLENLRSSQIIRRSSQIIADHRGSCLTSGTKRVSDLTGGDITWLSSNPQPPGWTTAPPMSAPRPTCYPPPLPAERRPSPSSAALPPIGRPLHLRGEVMPTRWLWISQNRYTRRFIMEKLQRNTSTPLLLTG